MLIVTYHSIDDSGSPVSTTLAQFERDLRRLKDSGATFASLDDCANWLASGPQAASVSAPAPRVAITFDDAYANVAETAVPVLQRYEAPATVFVIAGRLGLDNQWPGQWSGIPRMALVSAADVRRLAADGVSIGCHTSTHPLLTSVDDGALRRECLDSAEALEQLTGAAIRHFAYPYGVRGLREKAIVARRYRSAASARPAVVEAGSDVHDLPRIDPHDLRVALTLRLIHSTALPSYLALRRSLRAFRRRVLARGR